MNKSVQTEIIGVTVALVLIFGIAGMAMAAHGKTYTAKVNIKFYGNAECIAQKTDEAYYRISSNVANPNNNNNHDQLVVKATLENLGDYLINLQNHDKPLVVSFIGKFDPAKFLKKYGTPLKVLREYIELYLNDNLIHNEYKYQNFDPKRTSYTFNHGVNLGC
jgi:hypothetical protein